MSFINYATLYALSCSMQSFSDTLAHNYYTNANMGQIDRCSRSIGDYKLSCRSSDFDGWLVCDGRTVSTTMYAPLYDLVANSFVPEGVSLDEGMFMIPDARGNVLGAVSETYILGTSTGSVAHAILQTEMPSHTHPGTTGTSGGHTHTLTDPGHAHTETTISGGSTGGSGTPVGCADSSLPKITGVANIASSVTGASIASAPDHSHSFVSGATGSGFPMSLMQPTVFAGTLFIFAG